MTNILSGAEFAKGKQYPPKREQTRVANMDRWFRRSNRMFQGMFEDEVGALPLQRRLNVSLFGSSRRLSPNIYRFITDFWRDAVTSDRPVISYNGNDRTAQFVDALSPTLIDALTEVVPDMIRYGISVFHSKPRTGAVWPFNTTLSLSCV